MHKAASTISGDGWALLGVVSAGVLVLADGWWEGQQQIWETKHCRTADYCHSNVLLSSKIVRELEKKGFIVIDNALNSKQLSLARADAIQLQDTLGISSNATFVRSDLIRFLKHVDRHEVPRLNSESKIKETMENNILVSDSFGLLHAQLLIRGLGSSLLANNFNGFGDITGDNGNDMVRYSKQLSIPEEVQLSLYKDSNSFYKAHRDGVPQSFGELGLLQWLKFAGYRSRVITAILYLNEESPEWVEESHGGSLRLYLGAHRSDDVGTTAAQVHDIAPKGGRLILFDSQVILHEVLPTRRDRIAITVWFTV